jgi:hypothetical protein
MCLIVESTAPLGVTRYCRARRNLLDSPFALTSENAARGPGRVVREVDNCPASQYTTEHAFLRHPFAMIGLHAHLIPGGSYRFAQPHALPNVRDWHLATYTDS